MTLPFVPLADGQGEGAPTTGGRGVEGWVEGPGEPKAQGPHG